MKLALSLPWQGGTTTIDPGYQPLPQFDPNGNASLGLVITSLGEVALYAGGFLMFFWAVWGVFDYIRAEGNKEALAKARKRIQWAIAGFIILIMAFFLSSVVQTFLQPKFDKIQTITPPK